MGVSTGNSSDNATPMTTGTRNSLVRSMAGAVTAPLATAKSISKTPPALKMNSAKTVKTSKTCSHCRRRDFASRSHSEDKWRASTTELGDEFGIVSRGSAEAGIREWCSGEAIKVCLAVRGDAKSLVSGPGRRKLCRRALHGLRLSVERAFV